VALVLTHRPLYSQHLKVKVTPGELESGTLLIAVNWCGPGLSGMVVGAMYVLPSTVIFAASSGLV